jgi:hypothetical protein
MHKYYKTNKRNKDYYKSKGICINCCKEQAEPNRVLCWECAEKDRNRLRTYDKKRKAQYKKRKTELCDAFGICTTCHKREKYKGKQCIDCYLKRVRKYKEKQVSNEKLPKSMWGEYERCMICGEERTKDSKLCEKHLEIARKNAENARKHTNNKVHIWREEINKSVAHTQTYTIRKAQFNNMGA